jgi:predicted NAD-dependent protein-ADP-ribosyltransferase YbiA (DUF1768 family)
MEAPNRKLERLGEKAISIKKKLLETVDAILVESEPYGDYINELINDESQMRE